MKPTLLDAVDVTEQIVLRFPYAKEIEVGETILSVQLTVKVNTGTDASPALSFVGTPQIINLTYEVLQSFAGRLAPVVYQFKCVATLSSGRKLTRISILPVQNF